MIYRNPFSLDINSVLLCTIMILFIQANVEGILVSTSDDGVLCLNAARDGGQRDERSQDGEEKQSGPAGEQILLQSSFQSVVVGQRGQEAHDGLLEQTAERRGEVVPPPSCRLRTSRLRC